MPKNLALAVTILSVFSVLSFKPKKKPINVAITGGTGNIAYSLAFRIAAGELFGYDQSINLNIIDIPQMKEKLNGVKMELDDCAFHLLNKVTVTSDYEIGFKDVDVAFLVGSKPRSKGMERSDLLKVNGQIFVDQGKALGMYAKKSVKVLVIGNPANTNCLIAIKHAKGLTPENFSSMSRLDHNRAKSILADHLDASMNDIENVVVWGNHSPSMFVDLENCKIEGKECLSLVDRKWYEETFNPKVGQRGAEIIHSRGLSSAASAANAAIDCMRDWMYGTSEWKSMGILSDGKAYGVPAGIVFSFPVTIENGKISIVPGIEFDEFGKEKMKKTIQELLNEKEVVKHLL